MRGFSVVIAIVGFMQTDCISLFSGFKSVRVGSHTHMCGSDCMCLLGSDCQAMSCTHALNTYMCGFHDQTRFSSCAANTKAYSTQ